MSNVFIDIGSHEGQELKQALAEGYEVHCFEPNVEMKKHLAPYESQATINYAAAWDQDGFAKLYMRSDMNDNGMSLSLINEKTNIDHDASMLVPTINIGLYLKRLDKDIDIIKIDAEGAEYHIIESILGIFGGSRIREWLVEDHSDRIYTWKDHRDKILTKVAGAGITLKPWKNKLHD